MAWKSPISSISPATENSGRIAQTDLVRRIHRNRDDGELGDTAFAILRVILRRLERDGKLTRRTAAANCISAG